MKLINMLVFILVFFCTSLLYSQVDSLYNRLGLDDIYILKVNFKEELLYDKCDCCSSVVGEKCVLVRGEIIEVLAMSDTSVFKKPSLLQKKQFFVLEDSEELNYTGEFIVSCANTCSSYLLKVNRILPNINKSYDLLDYYIGDLTICYDLNLIQKLQYRLGVRRNTIHRKAKIKSPESSPFVRYILKNY